MHFDLFYELAVPAFSGRSEADVFHHTLMEIAAAEEVGFRTAWLVEHHFTREYSHSSAPDLFLDAASQRTKHLRLGHAIIPLPYHHPVHIAERLATLDILTNGRVDFGFGRGFSPKEYTVFCVDMAESRERVAEALQILRLSLLDLPVNFAGKHYVLNDIDILPKTQQKTQMPFWSAAVSPESFELAAQLGVGVLVGPFKPWFMVKADIARYRQAWLKYQGQNSAPHLNPRVGMTVGIFCLKDGKRARAIAKNNITWFYRELLKQTAPVLKQLHTSYEYYQGLGSLKLLLEKTVNLTILETLGMVVAGTPEHCRKKLQSYADAGVDHLLCAVGAGGSAGDCVIESIQTLGQEVLPHFTDTSFKTCIS